MLVTINCSNCRKDGTYEIEENVSVLKQAIRCECGSYHLDWRSTKRILKA